MWSPFVHAGHVRTLRGLDRPAPFVLDRLLCVFVHCALWFIRLESERPDAVVIAVPAAPSQLCVSAGGSRQRRADFASAPLYVSLLLFAFELPAEAAFLYANGMQKHDHVPIIRCTSRNPALLKSNPYPPLSSRVVLEACSPLSFIDSNIVA